MKDNSEPFNLWNTLTKCPVEIPLIGYILMCVSLLMALLAYEFPRLKALVMSMNIELPLTALWSISVSDIIVAYPTLSLIFLLAVFALGFVLATLILLQAQNGPRTGARRLVLCLIIVITVAMTLSVAVVCFQVWQIPHTIGIVVG